MRDIELKPDELSLIAAARGAHDPSEAQRARVRRGLEVKLAAGVAAPLLATSSAMAMVGKVGAGVALLAALGTTAAYVATANHETSSPRIHQAPAPAPMPGPVAPAPAPPTEPSVIPNDPRPSPPRPRAPTARRSPAPATPSDLSGELTLMTQISDATKRGDVARAERLLADYDQRFPAAQLAQERAAAGVLLECAAGRTAVARAQARRFLERWPRSPLVARINASCAAEAKTP